MEGSHEPLDALAHWKMWEDEVAIRHIIICRELTPNTANEDDLPRKELKLTLFENLTKFFRGVAPGRYGSMQAKDIKAIWKHLCAHDAGDSYFDACYDMNDEEFT